MTITDEELLAVIDQVTIALGEILLSHRGLTEGLVDDQRIATARDRIEKSREEIDQEREKIRKTRDTLRRRQDLEKIRQDHEKVPQSEQKRPASMVPVQDQGGRVVGWVQSVGKGRFNILDQRGRVVAREIGNHTLDGLGRYAGRGRQGLRVLGQTMKA